MKVRFPLFAQTLGLLSLNLVLLLALRIIFFDQQNGPGWEALLYSPVGERVQAIAWAIHGQTQMRPIDEWGNVLKEFDKIYGAKFSIFDAAGHELAGEPIKLPANVLAAVQRNPRGRHDLDHVPGNKQISLVPVHSSSVRPLLHRPHSRFLLHTEHPDCFWVGVRIHLSQPVEGPGTVLSCSANLWQTGLFLDFGLLIGSIAAVLGLCLIIWGPFVYRITRSLAELTAATEKIAEGKFDTRLKANRWDEIGSLGEAVNIMADRLNGFVVGQKRFLGDTAHELCSPIARLQVALELLESNGSARQEATIKDIRQEVEEMSSLINELLAFSKAGLKSKEVKLVCVNLEHLLNEAVAKTFTDQNVKLEVPHGLCVAGDELLLTRAVTNVLRNSVRYASEFGPINIKAVPDGKDVLLTITDCGPGVPAEALKLLGEPFYRPEPSRSRNSGGVGLGLAIVKTCIEACDGILKVSNRDQKGLSVEIRLKADRASAQ